VRNLEHYCESLGIDLADEEIAVVGIPGSIATAVAALLAPRCRRLVLGARRTSPRAIHWANRLGARLEVDLPRALAEASIVVTATSSGDCIEPNWLRPGCLVLDVGVPSDVRWAAPARDDILILSAGYARVPASMPRDSFFLRFYHGIVPSCLGETMVLALEDRADSFSTGRELDLDRVREIGRLAEAHGFAFSEALACGQSLSPEARSQFLKVLSKTRPVRSRPPRRCDDQAAGEQADDEAINLAGLAECAAERYARHINPVLIGVGGPSGMTRTFVRGEGADLFDESGRSYLDFVAGFGSLNLGHNHPEVVAAVASALSQHAPGFSPGSVNPLAAALAEQLVAITPRGLEIVFFTNSGAESIEAALKLARAATGRSGLLSCLGSFHGKTFGALSVTANRAYQNPFGPLVPGCQAIPYGDAKALELALATRQYAAFVVEPIQGEGGMVTPPPGYLAEAHRLCREAGTLFIADEVQTGLGRTGPMFAVERDGIEPDILTLAKSLGGGLMPLGAMIARRDLWLKAYGSYQTFALHSSTFSGGSLACAAGLATLRVLRDSPALVHAARRGIQLREGLEAIAHSCPIIREVRGHGLMLGLEFHELSPALLVNFKGFNPSGVNWWLVPGHDDLLRSIPALYVQSNLLHEHAIYTQVTRSNPRVLRVQPPLILSAAQVERFLEALRATCAEWALISESAEAILSKSAGEMGPR
jgi:acetylornithine/succinyldiaminopimelate/putrescine aminotransferase